MRFVSLCHHTLPSHYTNTQQLVWTTTELARLGHRVDVVCRKSDATGAALRQRIQGTVVLEGIVKTDGSVTAARVIRSLDTEYGLDDAALKAFASMHFSPGTVSGRPVPVLITTEMSFNAR